MAAGQATQDEIAEIIIVEKDQEGDGFAVGFSDADATQLQQSCPLAQN